MHKKEPGIKGSIKALFKRKYDTVQAVNDVFFEIEEGELVGFIGLNGAGKTTTLKMLSGLLHPTGGRVEVLGHTPHLRKEEYLKQISFVMGQKSQLWWDLPAIETFNLNKEIYEVEDKRFKQVLGELLEMLELKDVVNYQVRQLSLGQRMKCELVSSLLHTPKVLFLDEPTLGLDVIMQKRIREFVKEYNKKHRATVILTSHYMDDVAEICKRIIMIHKGKIVFDGALQNLIKQYADYKVIASVFNNDVKKEELERLGKVVEYEPKRAVIVVKRGEVAHKAAEILKNYDVDDLDINEPRLEDVVRKIFGEGKQ